MGKLIDAVAIVSAAMSQLGLPRLIQTAARRPQSLLRTHAGSEPRKSTDTLGTVLLPLGSNSRAPLLKQPRFKDQTATQFSNVQTSIQVRHPIQARSRACRIYAPKACA